MQEINILFLKPSYYKIQLIFKVFGNVHIIRVSRSSLAFNVCSRMMPKVLCSETLQMAKIFLYVYILVEGSATDKYRQSGHCLFKTQDQI